MNPNLVSLDPLSQVVHLKLLVVLLRWDERHPVLIEVGNCLKVVVRNPEERLFLAP